MENKKRPGEIVFHQFHTHQLDVNFDFCGQAKGREAASLKPRIKSNYVFHYILHGSGTLQVNDTSISVEQGDCFILPKNNVTRYWPTPTDLWEYMWIGVSGTKLEEYLLRSSILDDYVIHCKPNSQFLSHFMTLMELSEILVSQHADLLFNSEIYKLLYALSHEHPNNRQPIRTPKEAFFFQAVTFIENYYPQPISVSYIASRLNISRGYLHRLFKIYLNTSPQAYLMKTRMDKSVELLLHTDYSVAKIANSVGYEDPLTFSRAFTNHFGQAPTHYRETK